MFPQVNRKQEFTGDEFEQIIFEAQSTNEVAKAYFAEEARLESPMQQSHRPEEQAAGRPRGRYMLPSDYAGMSTKMRENINSSDDMPYYHIRGKVAVTDKKVDWEIYLRRCIFTDEVDFTKLTSQKMISISECVFLKGLTINDSKLEIIFLSEIDGRQIKINRSNIKILSVSESVLTPFIEATTVQSLSLRS